MGLSTFDERTALTRSRLVVPADGVALLPLMTVDFSDARVDQILVANRDGIPHVVNLILTNGAVLTNLGSVSVTAGAGYAGTPSVDLLASIFPATQVGIVIQGGMLLGVQLAVAVVATFDMSFSAFGGRF